MAGGIGIILLVIILLLVIIIGGALYVTGGTLWMGKTRKQGDAIEGGPNAEHRPQHKEASSPTTEKTDVVGADEAAEERSR